MKKKKKKHIKNKKHKSAFVGETIAAIVDK